MSDPKIVLYFDVLSPFAYLAVFVLRTSPVFKPCAITYVPVLLGGIIQKTGNVPPMTVKNKGKWIAKERLRWARQFRVPMADEMPPDFPTNTVPVMRALAAVAEMFPDRLEAVVAAVYETSFVKRQYVHTLEASKPILVTVLGMSKAEEVLLKAQNPDIKQRLAQNTDEAIESGAFGLPWFKATNSKGEVEFFWGFDHLGQVCNHLGLEKPQQGGKDEGGWKMML